MTGYIGYDYVLFDRLASTTIAEHMTEVEEAHLKNYAFPAQLAAGGRVVYNCSGRGFDWPVQYRRHAAKSTTGANVRTFQPVNLHKTAYLPWRGYEVTDSISRIEVLENRGQQAIVNLLDGFMDRLKKSLDQELARQYFVNGTTYTTSWHGLETIFGNNGTVDVTQTAPSTARRSKNAADIAGYPSATYAGLSTELANYSGNQYDGIWPEGDADPQLDFWSPLILFGDSTNAVFGGSADTWVGQADEIIGFAVTHTSRLGGVDAQPTTCLLDRSLFNGLKTRMRGKETIFVSRAEKDVSLVALGFTNTIVVDGVECTFDSSLPVNTGYMYSYRNIELRCLEGQLLMPEGLEYDIDTQSHKAVVSTMANLKFASPRNFVKLVKNVAQLT